MENIVVYCSCPDATVAQALAADLLENQLCACINIIPTIQSIYMWQGKVEHANECLMLIKTRSSHFDTLQSRINAKHPYDVPEIIACPINMGAAPYLEWMRQVT